MDARLIRVLFLASFILPVANVGAAEKQAALFREVARRFDLQTEMPRDEVKPDGFDLSSLSISSEFLRLLLWGAVILGVGVTLWSLRDSLPVFSRSRRIIPLDEGGKPAGPARQMDEAQVEADDLAAQGYYNEAMHVLLHKSLHELHGRLGLRFAASLTSREILRRVQLPEDGRGALTRIIQAVEMTYFGGRQAGEAEYTACRDYFDVFRRTLGGVATA